MSPSVATRIVSDSASVETPRSAASWRLGAMRSSGRSSSAVEIGFSIDRDRAHLAGELVGRVVDRVDVGPGDDQRQVALAVVLDEPVADVGRRRRASRRCAPAGPSGSPCARDLLTKLMTKVALRGSARRRRGSGRRRSTPSALPAAPAAASEIAAGDAVGVGEPRAGRQLDRQQRAALVVGRQEARGQQLGRARSRRRRSSTPDRQRDPAVAHRGAHQPRCRSA